MTHDLVRAMAMAPIAVVHTINTQNNIGTQ